MRILFLTHRVPYPPDKGDRIRSFNIIKFLAQRHSISLMSLSHEPVQPKNEEILRQYCESVDVVRINFKVSALRSGLHLLTKTPLTLPAFYSRRFHDAVRAKLRSTKVDLIYIYSSSMAQYVIEEESGFRNLHHEEHEGHEARGIIAVRPGEGGEDYTTKYAKDTKVLKNINSELRALRDLRGKDSESELRALRDLCGRSGSIPKIMDFIDVDSQKWFDYAAKVRQPMKAVYNREGIRLRAFEKKAAARCDLSLFTSESELNIFRNFAPEARAAVLPNGVELPPAFDTKYRPNKLVFVGSMDYLPNVDSMVYFTGEILPLIQKEVPDVELFIVGRNPSTKVKALGRIKGVTVTGDVEDVGTYMRDAPAAVVPLRIARGIQNKILEAMAHGVPVITTGAALDGIAAKPGRDVLVADNPHDFAQKTLSVLKDRSLRNQLAVNGRALVEQEYRWENQLQTLEESLSSLQNRRALRVLRGESSDLRELRDLRGEQLPFVSFVIPAKNEAEMIGQCLDAINNIDYEPARRECIVVDNGSVDDTTKIARQKGAKVLSMPEGTISALRNQGAKTARGDYLAFIDADCVIDRSWLKNALPHFEDPAVGCVGSHPDIPTESTWVQRTWHLQNKNKDGAEEVDWLPSMNLLVRNQSFVDCDGFNESLVTCEDVDLCYRLKTNYKIVSDSRIKSVHLGEAKSVTEFFRKEHWRGQSNLHGLQAHGFCWEEVPSLLLPIYYLVATLALPFTAMHAVNQSVVLFVINLAALLLPALILTLRTSLRNGTLGFFVHLNFLYIVYAFARAAALISLRQTGTR